MKIIEKIKNYLQKKRWIARGKELLQNTKTLLIIWCVLFLGGVTNAQDTVPVSCTQKCTVQGSIIDDIRKHLDRLNPTLQCVDAELVESQIIELVKRIHKEENITCEVPKPETVIIDNIVYRDPIPTPAEIFTTWVKEKKVAPKKKKWGK